MRKMRKQKVKRLKRDKKKKQKSKKEAIRFKGDKKNKIARKISLVLFSLILLILIIALVLSFFQRGIQLPKNARDTVKSETGVQKFLFSNLDIKQPLLNSTRAIAYLPAVDKNGKGVITTLVVEAVQGSGRTLVDIDNLLFWADTQNSIRIAKNVASNISGINVNKYDLIYNIYANASVIGGESAGAAITLATISALENKSLRKDVVITGTINHDGSIGPVKGILAKAKASKEIGAKIFLVPLTQGLDVVYETKKHCEKFGSKEFCTTEQIPKRVNISKEANINIKEVATIKEASKYFF